MKLNIDVFYYFLIQSFDKLFPKYILLTKVGKVVRKSSPTNENVVLATTTDSNRIAIYLVQVRIYVQTAKN